MGCKLSIAQLCLDLWCFPSSKLLLAFETLLKTVIAFRTLFSTHYFISNAFYSHELLLTAGLFNPQSFLTAVMQSTARKFEWPLNRTAIAMDVTRFTAYQVNGPPKEGVYIHGMFLEGARWDEKLGTLDESRPKQLLYKMPVCLNLSHPQS